MTPWLIVAAVFAVLVVASRNVLAAPVVADVADNPASAPDNDFVGPINNEGNADMPARSTSDANVSQGVLDLADAIASAEGYGVPGAIPTRANNPGDLVMPNWRGETLGAERISVFATPEQGWIALWHQINLIATGRSHVYTSDMTIGEMADRYTSTQRPEWARNVAAYLASHGYPYVTVDTALGEIL